MDRVAIKAKAKEFAYANKWNIWAPFLVIFGITYAISFVLGLVELYSVSFEIKALYYIIELLEVLLGLALAPLAVGFASYMINLVRTGKKQNVNELFRFYRKDCMWKIILVYFIAELIIGALSLLLIIPGIIYALKYAMMVFIMAEQFDKEVKDAPEEAYKVSNRMMEGHKWEYCVFQLSFVGWFILCGLTLGILCIWIYPYYMVANTMWYDELKKISK